MMGARAGDEGRYIFPGLPRRIKRSPEAVTSGGIWVLKIFATIY